MEKMNPDDIVYEGEPEMKTPRYYSYRGKLYAPTFPEEWAKTHLRHTGPNNCANCAKYGYWKGVFIGYCANCAIYYNGYRGRGFIYYGKEVTYDYITGQLLPCDTNTTKSVFDTYLKGVELEYVGFANMAADSSILIQEGLSKSA